MPFVSRLMIRCSFIYLVVAMVLGAIMLIHKAWPLHPAVWQLLPLHIETAIFGWIIQFTLGTGYWMLPRFLKGPHRGSPRLAYLMIIALNIGILLTLSNSLFQTRMPLMIFGRLLELLAVILFISLHWNRIVTYRHS